MSLTGLDAHKFVRIERRLSICLAAQGCTSVKEEKKHRLLHHISVSRCKQTTLLHHCLKALDLWSRKSQATRPMRSAVRLSNPRALAPSSVTSTSPLSSLGKAQEVIGDSPANLRNLSSSGLQNIFFSEDGYLNGEQVCPPSWHRGPHAARPKFTPVLASADDHDFLPSGQSKDQCSACTRCSKFCAPTTVPSFQECAQLRARPGHVPSSGPRARS